MSRKRANVPPRDDWPSVQQAVRDLQAQIDGLVRAQGSQPSVPNTSDVVREVLGLLNTTTTAPGTTAGLSFGIPPVPIGTTLSEGSALNPARADHVHTLGQYACRAGRATTQSIPNDTYTAVQLNIDELDTDSMHDNATNNTRVTFNRAGIYSVGGLLIFAPNATGRRVVNVAINGDSAASTAIANMNAIAGGVDFAVISACAVNDFAAGDYIELYARQNSGGALNITLGELWAVRVS